MERKSLRLLDSMLCTYSIGIHGCYTLAFAAYSTFILLLLLYEGLFPNANVGGSIIPPIFAAPCYSMVIG